MIELVNFVGMVLSTTYLETLSNLAHSLLLVDHVSKP